MRILIVTHFYPPEIGAPQARLSELARTWAGDGDEVTVLTGLPNHPTGVVPPAYRGVWRRSEHVEGSRVIRTWLYATPNEGIVKKTLGHLSFMVSSVVLGAPATGPVDVVVVSSPTFFSILGAWVIARARRARFVVEIRDLWPAIFVELGVLTNPLIIRALETIELAAYRAADEVVVVSEGFRANLIERGVPAAKIHTIRNGVDLERFTAEQGDAGSTSATRAELGAEAGEALVLYIGAHGISHGLTSVADAAARLQDDPVHLAFVGEGAAKAELEARVHDLGLHNVTMRPGVPRDRVAGMLQAADICLVPLRDVPLFATFIPSKIFEYFGAGKAVIGAVRGEPAEILRDGGAVVVEPEDPAALADAIRALAGDPARRAEMGRAARSYVAEHFDRVDLARTYRAIIAGPGDRASADRRPGDDDRDTRPGAPAAAGLRTAPALVRYVWRHPENARGGWSSRSRGVARLLAWQLWERTAKRPWTITTPGGMRLRCHPHDPQSSAVLYCGMPEFEDLHFVCDYLRAGDRFVDVGANVGVFSLAAASVGGTEIDAFEPSTTAFPRLIENITLNGLEPRFHGHARAVGRRAGIAQLTTGLQATNRLVSADDAEGRPSETVEVVTLDESLGGTEQVAIVKIDVEGAEEDVLRGAHELLSRDRPALIIEANDRAAIAAVLEPLGYRSCSYDPATGRLDEVGWKVERGNNLLAVVDLDGARHRLRQR